MFLKNCWYVAAPSHEMRRKLLARTLLGTPVVLFRRENGAPVALEDRCAHRFLPLSMGRLLGDEIECGYHGLVFNCQGTCLRVPGQKSVPKGADIRSYPVVEKWRLVWIWMGDPELADEALIPNIWRNDHPDWAVVCGDPLPMKGDYRLVADNLLDPSHVSFVHRTTLGTEIVAEIPHETKRDGVNVNVMRWILDKPAAPVYAALGHFTGNVDRWQIINFTPPSLSEVNMGSTIAGTGAQQGNRSQGIELHAFNMITPETETSSFYFWTHVRNFDLDDDDVSAMIREQFLFAFNEDVAVIEACQRGLDTYPDVQQVNISVDGGPILARRVLDELIEAEQAGRPALEPEMVRVRR